VRVDGPYGSAGDLTAHRRLVLVAGGIGITPIHSVVGWLLAAARQDALRHKPLQSGASWPCSASSAWVATVFGQWFVADQ
jgi:hypothetical protein